MKFSNTLGTPDRETLAPTAPTGPDPVSGPLPESDILAEVEGEELLEVLAKHGVSRDRLKAHGKLVVTTVSALHQGPLPPPTMLGEYDSVMPGCAERIVSMAEQEQRHRHRWELEEQRRALREVTLGQVLGFILIVCAFLSAVVFALRGDLVVAGMFLGATVLGAATKFIPGIRKS